MTYSHHSRAALALYLKTGELNAAAPTKSHEFDIWMITFCDHPDAWRQLAVAKNRAIALESYDGFKVAPNPVLLRLAAQIAQSLSEHFDTTGGGEPRLLMVCPEARKESALAWLEVFQEVRQEFIAAWRKANLRHALFFPSDAASIEEVLNEIE